MRTGVILLVLSTMFAPPAAAQPFAYVLGHRDDDPGPAFRGVQQVSVVSLATNQRVARIAAGTGCWCGMPNGIAVTMKVARSFAS